MQKEINQDILKYLKKDIFLWRQIIIKINFRYRKHPDASRDVFLCLDYNMMLCYILLSWSGARAVRERSAKPSTAVQLRSGPQKYIIGRVVKLVYTQDLKFCGRKAVRVRVPPRPLK